MKIYRQGVFFLLAALFVVHTGTAFAQSYPNKPIRFIVPFAAGGAVDSTARAISESLGNTLGQPIIVDNLGGGGGLIAAAAAARAPADGYTFFLPATSYATGVVLYKDVGFNPAQAFEPVTLIAEQPLILVVNPKLPANSVSDLIKLAKSKPGSLNFGSSGTGGNIHFAGELFKKLAGIEAVHVPYRGTGPAMTDLMAGQTQFMFADSSVLPQVRAGTLRALAVTTQRRSKLLPDLPTVAESLPGYEAHSWTGLLAPAKTPKAIIMRMQEAVAKAVKDPKAMTIFTNLAMEPVASTPDQFGEMLQGEIKSFAELAQSAGLKHLELAK